jgi:LPXTG-site transpeptidase (sortase) family protein
MTVVASPSAGTPGEPGEGIATSHPRLPRPGQRLGQPWRERASLPRQVITTTMLILGVVLLAFSAYVAVVSRLHYDRVQYDDYASFRAELAQATAPTGPTQPSDAKQLLTTGTPVAVLHIPEIGLNAVVLEGTSNAVLEDGPGHLRDTVLPGQVGVSEILGRRAAYGGPFARINSLSPGQVFTVTTGQGVSRYRVLDVRQAGDQVPPYSSGQGRLILATADGPAFAPTGVLRVDANEISTPEPAPAMVLTAANLPADEQSLGTNPLAWVTLVLWGMCLVASAVGVGWLGQRWGRWQAWIIAVPVLSFLGFAVADQAVQLLPNLM